MKRPTQQDVANRAGVSRATVSLVINNQNKGSVRISEETRQRVFSAVEELGYQPDWAAQSLRTSRTNLLALLVPDITNPYYPMLIRGAQGIAEQNDFQLLIYDSDDSPEREKSFVNTVLRRRVDGVILVSFHLSETDLIRLQNSDIEIVAIGNSFSNIDLEINRTRQNHHQAIQALIAHLAENGHHRIAHIAGPQDTPPGQLRLTCYRDALSSAGIPYDPDLVQIGSFRQDGIHEIVHYFVKELPQSKRPSAIFAANDVMAIETIYELTKLNIRVPDEIAVCGFDNIPQSAWVAPALTTVGQNPFEHGRKAASILMSRLCDNLQEIQQVEVPYNLVIRNST